jgi:hypothetical protein
MRYLLVETDLRLRRKVSKRSYPRSPAVGAAVTLPSSLSPPQDEDIPLAKMPRLLVPFPATAEEDVRKTDSEADLMTAMQPNASATSGPPFVSTLENDTELTIREVEPTVQRKHTEKSGLQLPRWLRFQFHFHFQRVSVEGMVTQHIPDDCWIRGMWSADQVNINQIRNHVNHGYAASTVALGLGQRESSCWTGWSPRGGAWHGCNESNGYEDIRPRQPYRNAVQ